MPLDDLYREVIMDHYRNPQNRGSLERATSTISLNNPLCGDEITLQLVVDDGHVVDARWVGEGCSISMSSASMMTEAVKGLTVDEARHLMANFQGLMHGEDLPHTDVDLGDLEALSGVAKFPVRIKCALLAWEALSKSFTESATKS